MMRACGEKARSDDVYEFKRQRAELKERNQKIGERERGLGGLSRDGHERLSGLNVDGVVGIL